MAGQVLNRDLTLIRHMRQHIRAIKHNHVPNMTVVSQRLIQYGLHREGLTTPLGRGDGENRFGARKFKALRNRFCAKTGKQGQYNIAQTSTGHEGCHSLGNHGHVESDYIANTKTQGLKPSRQFLRL